MDLTGKKALAFNLVAKAAAQVHRTAFKILIQGDADK